MADPERLIFPDMTRSEFEYEIPLVHAQAMMADMCPFKMEKYRYRVEFEGFVYEIDEYFGDNAPLIVAEIELPSEDTEFPKPSWLGKEITSDGKFTNAYLSKHPYSSLDGIRATTSLRIQKGMYRTCLFSFQTA